MRYLKIQNDGVLDIRLVALMGGTTKANDKYKIGQFGTGLKYTLAFLFRNNLDFKIFAGIDQVQVHTEQEIIREETFDIICINGNRTSITTKMGEDWEAWMIMRELWCNALDEGGAVREITEIPAGVPGKTTFCIQIDSQVQKILNNWSKYFIHDQIPIFENDEHALYPAGDHLCIYKQGVLIYEDPTKKGVFGYDYKSASINELREYKHSASMAIVYSLANCNEQAARYFIENVTEAHYEGSEMDYNWYRSFGNAWKSAIGNAKLIYQKVLDEIKARGNTVNESDLVIVPKPLYKFLTKQFEGIGALHTAGVAGEFYEQYNVDVENKLKQAFVILEACNYPVHPDLKFIYGWFEDKRVQARVSLNEKTVRISNTLLQKPIIEIVSIVIEENEHFNTGFTDMSREFQTHFINLYARQLLSKHGIEI